MSESEVFKLQKHDAISDKNQNIARIYGITFSLYTKGMLNYKFGSIQFFKLKVYFNKSYEFIKRFAKGFIDKCDVAQFTSLGGGGGG